MYQIGLDGSIRSYDAPINGNLVIPGIIDGITVTKLYPIDNNMSKAKNIKRIVIPKTVEQIDSYAFMGCINLSEVIIEEGSRLNIIKDFAFVNCRSLKAFPFERTNNLTNIGEEAFRNSGLEEVNLSKTKIQTIGNESFCIQNLKSVILPNTLEFIGEKAFMDTSITELDLSVVKDNCVISKQAFYHNVLLSNIKFPSNKEIIIEGEKVFSCCYELKEVTIPSTVNIKGEECFDGCFALETVNFLKEEVCADRKIPCYTFYGCDKLTTVNINYPFTEIDDYAFSKCEILNEIKLPMSIKRIGRGAFSFCYNLSLVDLSNCNVEIVDELAFEKTSINIEGFKMNYFSSTQFFRNSFRDNKDISLANITTKYPFVVTEPFF